MLVDIHYRQLCIQLDYEYNVYKTIAYNDYINNKNNSHSNEYGSGRMILLL